MIQKYNVGDVVWTSHGKYDYIDLGTCPVCNGTGYITLPLPDALGGGTQRCYCPVHNGTYLCKNGILLYGLRCDTALEVVIDTIFIDGDGVEYGISDAKQGYDYGDVRESDVFASKEEALAHIDQKELAF